MMDFIKIPVAMLAGMAISTLGVVIIYDGISLPYFGQVINGRVQNAVEAAKSGLVEKSKLDAVEAALTAMTLRAKQAETLAEQARVTGEAIKQKEGQSDDALKESVEADRRVDGAHWSASDIDWLCNERKRLGLSGTCSSSQSGR